MEQNMQQSCTDNRNIPTAKGATAETPPCATSAPDNFATKQKILQKLQEYDNILLVRHVRPDGDALGSVRGLAQVLRQSFPEKHIYATGADTSDYLAFMGADDALPPEETCRRALCLALDVATPDRASGEAMSLAAETVKIDHHVETVPCEGLSWVEEKRSSTCEMVAELCLTFPDVLKLDITSATALYIGINVKKVIIRTMLLSGAICGLVGFLIVGGVDCTISPTDTIGSIGFTAILVSWMAKFNPLLMVLTSALVSFLEVGTTQVATGFKLDGSISNIVTAIVLLFVVGSEFFVNYKIMFRHSSKEVFDRGYH